MSWVAAIRSYLNGSTRNIAAQKEVFKIASEQLLPSSHGSAIKQSHLDVLRELRWILMKNGTPKAQSQLLEFILQTFSNSYNNIYWDQSTQNDLSIIAEQLQCVVEGKVCGILLGPQHYRHLLSSPQLSKVSADAPALLMQDLRQHIENDENLREAYVDCCVGLAGSGHTKEAFEILQKGQGSLSVAVRRITQLQKAGWKNAWELVQQIDQDQLTKKADTDFLDGAAFAALACYDATLNLRMNNYLKILCTKYLESQAETKSYPPISLLSAYLKTADPSQWKQVLSFMVELGVMPQVNNEDSAINNHVHPTDRPPLVGRLMKLLLHAEQPLLALQLFYGEEQVKSILSTGVQSESKELLSSSSRGKSLIDATGKCVSAQEKNHPAIYNYALESLACLGHESAARRFYEEMLLHKVNLTNRHTHKQIARVFLNPNTNADLCNDDRYVFVHKVLKRLLDMTRSDNEVEHFIQSFVLWTALRSRHGSCLVIDNQEMIHLSLRASDRCRYIRIVCMAHLIVAAVADKCVKVGDTPRSKNLLDVFNSLLLCSSCTLKQISLALVFLACTHPSVPKTDFDDAKDGVVLPVCGGDFTPAVYEVVLPYFERTIKTQTSMDSFIGLLAEYGSSIHSRQKDEGKTVEPDRAAKIPHETLQPQNLLSSTMDILAGTTPNPEMWTILINALKRTAEITNMSVTYAGLALVSAGVNAELAIGLIPQ